MKSPKKMLLIGRRMIRANVKIISKTFLFMNPNKLNIIYSKIEYIIIIIKHILMINKNNNAINIYFLA